ncbi:MAG: 30S ribosomal protein S13 [Candidatus Aenigmarchaeota archaeon]|nr:30S ribosomal protein S13 [Candidatus Aenigmarchaeota archaeon]
MSTKQAEQMRGIIRIAGVDMKGDKKIYVSLQRIKGVGPSMANVVCKVAKMDRNRKAGTLTDDEIKNIEKILSNIKEYVPTWMLNRRNDPETGENYHLITSNLKFTHESDIKKMIERRTYKGVRHAYGLPVRGQRTRSSFRKGKSVGVVRKKQQPGKKK